MHFLLETDEGARVCWESLMREYVPTSTVQYARAMHVAVVEPINVSIRHHQLFITKKWRIRRELLPAMYTDFIDLHTHRLQWQSMKAYTRHTLKNYLFARLAPAARKAVAVMLTYHDQLHWHQEQNASRVR